jgi:hypothetical protein
MMKSLLPLYFGLGLAAAAPLSAFAQGPSDFEAKYVEHIQLQHPDFRIVKKFEDFPERYNASVELPIIATTTGGDKTNRAFVTLHDGVTGEPMESCLTPCTLHKSPGRSVFIFAYKRGYFTFPTPIQADPSEMHELHPYWDGRYAAKLGTNFGEIRMQSRLCERKLLKMDKTKDADAVPCYRTPPMVPAVNYSGECQLVFDVSAKGRVENAKATECSDQIFAGPSLFAINHWSYIPKIERGVAVPRPDVKTRFRFDVTDFDGTLLDRNGNRVEG